MIVSYNWLQSHFEEKLPEPEKLSEILIFHAFEVESIGQKEDDYMLDIDILPNRASDSLSHRGIAREISTLTGLPLKVQENIILETPHPNEISLDIQDSVLCRRYLGKVIGGVKVGSSPDWLKDRLESIEQKSINNVVDATNFIMFDIGQPLHAFDLDKIDGEKIIVRKAKKGEKITTLDNKEVELDESVLIIADEKDPLAIAGVKGGKKAEVDENTTRIVIEAANFDPVSVRKTSRRLGILTDSSKRFENEITPKLAGEAIGKLAFMIRDFNGSEHIKIGESIEFYPKDAGKYKIGVSVNEVNKVLGTNLKELEIEDILKNLQFEYEKIEDPIQKVLDLAPTFVGVPYKYGASITYDAPRFFDCSSFTSYLFAQAGIAIPRMTIDQYVFGEKVKEEDLSPGDLVFPKSNGNTEIKHTIHYESKEFLPGIKVDEGIDHNGIYLGGGKIIHAAGNGYKGMVVVEDMKDSPAFQNILGFRRIIKNTAPRFVVTVPDERTDLKAHTSFLVSGNKEDLIEEIGRVYGYKKITPKLPKIDFKPGISKNFYYANKLRLILKENGFSEVYNYTLTGKGDVELENPLASDKNFLRTNLSAGTFESLKLNEYNAVLLGVNKIKIFEIGRVFTKDSEYMSFCIGIKNTQKMKEKEDMEIKDILDIIKTTLEINLPKNIIKTSEVGAVCEINFEELIEQMPDKESYGDTLTGGKKEISYKDISPYPFMLRDIAVWTPSGTQSMDVLNAIKEKSGDLLAQIRPFDMFEKNGRISYAFSLVFQSHEKTLTDQEVNKIMDSIADTLNNTSGYEVR